MREVEASNLGAQQNQEVDLSKLPSVEQMSTMKAKEGEIVPFRNGDVGEAYMYSKGKWELIGHVTSGPDSGGQQAAPQSAGRYYEGDRLFEAGEYDHIIDVDLGDGIMRKLPFNNGGNAMDAAGKFCARENLSRASIEQIT